MKDMSWLDVRTHYERELADHLVHTLTGHGKLPYQLYPDFYRPDELWFSKPDYRKHVLVNVGSLSGGFDTSTIRRHYRLSGILQDYLGEKYNINPTSTGLPDPYCMMICDLAMKHRDITQYKLNIKNQENVHISHEAAEQATMSAIRKCLQDAHENIEAAKSLLGQYEKRRPKTRSKTRCSPHLNRSSA